MKILIATDAFTPQTNGVVTTLINTIHQAEKAGHEIKTITPSDFTCIPNKLYPEIRLAIPSLGKIASVIKEFDPYAIHISTEGPIGMATKFICDRKGINYTTAYHTKFPEYLKTHLKIPMRLSYKFMRLFHGRSSCVMVSTDSLYADLSDRGFTKLGYWRRGVDTDIFHPLPRTNDTRPISIYVGRVSPEKNIEAFLRCRIPGQKIVVGDGPAMKKLQAAYPDVRFTGMLKGYDLARAYSNADVMVFPSVTDTFGLVIIESLACGTPVAAFPVTGPKDIITSTSLGCLDTNLEAAIHTAMATGDRAACREAALKHSWQASAEQFVSNLVHI